MATPAHDARRARSSERCQRCTGLSRDQLTSQPSPVGADDGRFPVRSMAETFRPASGSWKTNVAGMERLAGASRLIAVRRTRCATSAISMTFPRSRSTTSWDDTGRRASAIRRSTSFRRMPKVIERCMLMTHRPRRPCARPDLRLRHHGATSPSSGGGVGSRSTPRGSRSPLPGSGSWARGIPYYLLADSEAGRAKESALSGSAAAAGRGPQRHPARVRLRAGPAHHAEVDRQQPRHRRGHVPRGDRRGDQAARRVRAALRQAVRGQEEGPGRRAVHGREPVAAPLARLRRQRVGDGGAVNTDTVADPGDGDAAFEQSIMANLQAAGIQNGRKNERLEFDSVEPYAGAYIQAVGHARASRGGHAEADRHHDRAAVRHGRPGVRQGRGARGDQGRGPRPAVRPGVRVRPAGAWCSGDEYAASADDFAEVAAERRLGRIPVLLVRMNADLVMGEELKKTGAGNLFTVFGEPDIEIETSRRRAARRAARRRRLRPEHRRVAQRRHRPDRAVDDRHAPTTASRSSSATATSPATRTRTSGSRRR